MNAADGCCARQFKNHADIELRVFPSDLAAIEFAGKTGLCMKGARAWFAAHGFSWADFVRDGIPAATVLATGDTLAEAAVAVARQRVGIRNQMVSLIPVTE
jgi:hypothetical protein